MPESIYNIPVAFAFGAGMVAAFNPCGSAMLPAYVGYHLSSEGKPTDPLKSTLHGLYLGAVVTAGFVFLSLIVGFVITIGGDVIFGFVPFAGLGVGIVIALLGFWLLITGKHIGIWAATRINERSNKVQRIREVLPSMICQVTREVSSVTKFGSSPALPLL